MFINPLKYFNILKNYSFLYLVLNVVAKAITSVSFILLGIFLHPLEYGKFSLLYSLQTAMISFSGVGVYESVVGELGNSKTLSRRKILFRKSFYSFFLTAFFSFITLTVYFFFITKNDIEFTSVISSLLIGALLSFFIMQSNFYRIIDNYPLAIFFGVFISFCITIILFSISFYIESVKLSYFFALVFLILLSFYSYKKKILFVNTKKLIRVDIQYLNKISPFFVIAIFGWLSGYGMNLIIYQFFPIVEISKYSFLLTLSGVVQLCVSSINMIWAPIFYKLYLNDDLLILKRKEKFLFNVVSISIVFVALLFFFSTPFLISTVKRVDFSNYLENRKQLLLIFFGYLLTIPWWVTQNYFHINKAGLPLMRINIIYGSIGMILWFVLIYFFNVWGIYIGFVVQAFSKSLGVFLYSRKKWAVHHPILSIAFASIIFLLLLLIF